MFQISYMILKYSNIEMHKVFSIYNIIKILIFITVAFYLFGNFVPYYDGADSFLYGITTIDLFEGSFGFTNDLLQSDGSWEFVPYQWSKTIYNSAIPIGDQGIYGFTSIFYFLGGHYGLFYLGPILTILFLIGTERVATNLFGRTVGLITLVLLATDFIILWIGIQLRNDNIFALFFVLGCYFLIKFLHEKSNKSILLCSIFFAAGSVIRINGIIAFPLEILLIIGYFAFHTYNKTRSDLRFTKIPILIKNIFQKIRKKDFIKKTTFVLIPWILFCNHLRVLPACFTTSFSPRSVIFRRFGTPDTKNEDYWNGEVLWATPTDITNLREKFIFNTKRKISNLGLEKSSAKILPSLSLLMTSRASIGFCAINLEEICTNQGFQNIIPNEKINVEFLYYTMQTQRIQNILNRYAYGSTFLEIPNKVVKKIKIYVPNMEEQKKIVQILSNIDDAIENDQNYSDILKEIKKGLMQDLLTGKKRVKLVN